MNLNSKAFKKMIKELGPKEALAGIADAYFDEVHDKKKPKPVGKKNYVGIEVECFSSLEQTEVLALLLTHDLEKYVNITDDGSISAPRDKNNSYEFRILSTEKQLPIVLKKLNKFFKAGKFETNNSCGLHVHLDMRHRNVDKCYDKLLKFQDIMYSLVNSRRWRNDYCRYSRIESMHRRHSSINRMAYNKHKTIEVRLHQGTMNTKQIQNWVNLLIKAIGPGTCESLESKEDVLTWVGKCKELKSYIQKNFNSRWASSKSRVIARFYPTPSLPPIDWSF